MTKLMRRVLEGLRAFFDDIRVEGNNDEMFEYQAPATLNQASPVQNTWYDILATTGKVKIYQISVNIEDANEDLEVQAVIDGQTVPAVSWTATHSTNYYIRFSTSAIARTINLYGDTNAGILYQVFGLEGHSVRIRVRKTSANGTGNLTGVVSYGVLK